MKTKSINDELFAHANRFKLKDGRTLIIPGARHYSKDMAEVLDVVKPQLVTQQVCDDDQGFIDQYSNYWTREEAMIIATYAGQVSIERGSEKELYSEDLY
nr:unknown [Tequatrovirus T4]